MELYGQEVRKQGTFQANILHLLGIDHTRLTYFFQGRHFRLRDVHGKLVRPILDQSSPQSVLYKA